MTVMHKGEVRRGLLDSSPSSPSLSAVPGLMSQQDACTNGARRIAGQECIVSLQLPRRVTMASQDECLIRMTISVWPRLQLHVPRASGVASGREGERARGREGERFGLARVEQFISGCCPARWLPLCFGPASSLTVSNSACLTCAFSAAACHRERERAVTAVARARPLSLMSQAANAVFDACRFSRAVPLLESDGKTLVDVIYDKSCPQSLNFTHAHTHARTHTRTHAQPARPHAARKPRHVRPRLGEQNDSAPPPFPPSSTTYHSSLTTAIIAPGRYWAWGPPAYLSGTLASHIPDLLPHPGTITTFPRFSMSFDHLDAKNNTHP
ncbi:hypothetical protein GMOD_00010054 [Pyrenophora seminiperda CCB06]|uniref:Uncharacterized protein n=1 Tax=Pyrenophora seminiperda CCB06 TaxID=1302712 RepID=A0A3M7M1Q4_9PLEO|nr:hypothetical protein GMOD_00010054 [Pyrenophora seminiperda CCB06]